MSVVGNTVYDDGLNGLRDNCTSMHLCSAQPANYAGLAAVTLGYKTSPTIGAPEDATSGRRVQIATVSDGVKTISAETVATHYALVDDTNDELLVAEELTAEVTITLGEPWKSDAFYYTSPAPSA